MITACDIHLERGGASILRGLDFDLRGGEFVALLGPNGAGKSSLRKVLTGEWTDFSGTVRLDDVPLPEWSPRDLARRRAVLPQEPRLTFPFTVNEVVELGRLPWQDELRPEADREAAAVALEEVGLHGFAERLYPTLSGGEKQRVHLARVLAQIDPRALTDSLRRERARFLFLDEPTNNLDLAGRHTCLRLARRAADQGIGVFAILHDPNDALAYADRVMLLRKGALVAVGAPGDVLTADAVSSLFGVTLRLDATSDGSPSVFRPA
jgi:iron complex transport system ATP-binding protein